MAYSMNKVFLLEWKKNIHIGLKITICKGKKKVPTQSENNIHKAFQKVMPVLFCNQSVRRNVAT